MTGGPDAPVAPIARRPRPGRGPIVRSGHHLVLGSTLGSAFGLVYWVVAARLYPPEVVGRESTLLYTMMFLAGMAQLGLVGALLRFVPVAGDRTRALVGGSCAIGGGLAAVAGAVFALGAPLWSPEHVSLLGGAGVAWFAVATAAWAVFVLQESVLTAIGRAALVPATKLTFAVGKLAALVLLAATLPVLGIVVSWTACTLVVVVGTAAYLATRGRAARGTAGDGTAEPITLRRLTRYVGGDTTGSLFWTAGTMLLPLLVLNLLGPADAAVYAIAWAIAYAFYLASSGMGNSLVAHAAAAPAQLNRAWRELERHTLLLLLPVVAVVVIGAPLILSVLGELYADRGTWLLRLLALSALPNVVTRLAVSAARVRQDMRTVVAVQATTATAVITAGVLLAVPLGVTGFGLGWLLGQTGVALVVVWSRLSWWPSPIGRLLAAPRRSRRLRAADAALQAVPGCEGWRPHGDLAGCSDSATVLVGPDPSTGGVLKVAMTGRARTDLTRQAGTLAALHAEPRVTGRLGVPRILPGTTGDGWTVESRLPGSDARAAAGEPDRCATIVDRAVAAVATLHHADTRLVDVDDDRLRLWVRGPAGVLRETRNARHRGMLDTVTDRICAGLAGRRLPAGWTHGDLCLDNILIDSDDRVTGIVDWSQARPDGLVVTDLMHLHLTAEATVTGRPLGAVVLDWVDSGGPHWERIDAVQRAFGPTSVDARTLVLLAWLQHVSGNVAKSARYETHPLWNHRNVRAVLAGVTR